MSLSWNFITPRLATGGGITVEGDVQELADQGITHVIDTTDAEDDAPLITHSMAYLYNPTADDGTHKEPAWFGTSLTFALPVFAVPRAKLYAHCTAGMNRGPSTAYAIMLALGWDGPGALALIKTKRLGASVAYAADAVRAVSALGYV